MCMYYKVCVVSSTKTQRGAHKHITTKSPSLYYNNKKPYFISAETLVDDVKPVSSYVACS